MRLFPLLLILVFQNLFFLAWGQEMHPPDFRIPDSIRHLNFEELKSRSYQYREHDNRSKFYALAYYKKSTQSQDTIARAWGYYLVDYVVLSEDGNRPYLDSVEKLTINWRNSVFPSLVFHRKAMLFREKGNYNGTIDNLKRAIKYAERDQDLVQFTWNLKSSVSAIKSEWGNKREALEIDKAFLKFMDSDLNTGEKKYGFAHRITGMLNLAIGYLDVKEYDSTLYIAKKGYQKSLSHNDTLTAQLFSLVSGEANYYMKDYVSCIDSLKIVEPYLFESGNSNCKYVSLYLGLSYYELNQLKEAIYHLKKADSIYVVSQREFAELKELYQTIIKYYQIHGDIENQLLYLDKLLAADSVLIENYRYVGDNISKKIDAPFYMARKDQLLLAVQSKKKGWRLTAWIAGILTFAGAVWFYFYHKKQKKYKQLFEDLLAKNRTTKPERTSPSAIDLKPDLASEILDKLKIFEEKKAFLQRGLTQSKMAVQLDTNTSYISKVINGYKQKSFINYIHDLRIDHSIELLQKESKYRGYSIKAIGEELGYASATSFTRAFYERTGLYPSWFIKQLSQKKDTTIPGSTIIG